ncbi:MAG: hypothetical protein LBJ70_03260 [Holosporales bacterium]|jgi:hypothetical protein|nr:hypothetical protein [Holosporales bacterium]
MHIDRGIRACGLPTSYSVEIWEDLPLPRGKRLFIGNAGVKTCGVLTEDSLWPTKILVSSRMLPERILAQPTIQRLEDNIPCQAIPLYHDAACMDDETRQLARRSRWSAIRLEYAGTMRLWFSGNQEALFVRGTEMGPENILFAQGSTLYRKPFVTQEADIRDGYVKTPHGMLPVGSPPEEKRLQLRCYGGLWEPGVAPENVEPVFFQCINLRQQTHILCTRRSYWTRKGADVFAGSVLEGRTLHVVDTVPEEARETLGDAITKGRVRLTIEKPGQKSQAYQSVRFFKDPHWEDALEILFLPTR